MICEILNKMSIRWDAKIDMFVCEECGEEVYEEDENGEPICKCWEEDEEEHSKSRKRWFEE